MYFNVFNASLKAHTTRMQTMLEKIFTYALLYYAFYVFLYDVIYFANVCLTHDLPMHQSMCLIVSGYVDM